MAVQYFREYLYGVQFSIFSDHQSHSHLTTSDVPHIRLARLQQYLKAYDYVVEYKSGKKLGNADSLSRMFEEDEDPSPFQNLTQSTTMVNAIKLSQNLHFNRQLFDADLKWFIELKRRKHNRAPNLKTWLANDHLAAELNPVRRSLLSQYDKLILIHDRIYRETLDEQGLIQYQYLVPEVDRQLLLQQYHDSVFSGHLAFERTRNRISTKYYWPKYLHDIKIYCEQCVKCQQNKIANKYYKGPLNPLRPSRPFQVVTSDVMGPLPSSAGN